MYNRLKNHTTQHKRYNLCEGSLEVKLPTIWTDGKAEGKSQRREEKKREDQRRGRVRGKKTQAREKVEQSRFNAFFQWFVTPLWREAHFEVKMHKTLQCWTSFRTWDVEKVDAAVAPSTFPSKNVQNTPGSDHFLKLTCRKIARRCGAKHISKSKSTKHVMFGALLEVEMSKKCTPLWWEAHFGFGRKSARLWRKAHFEVKSVKNWRVRSSFGSWDVEKCTPLWREAYFEVKSAKTDGSGTLLDVQMSFRVAGARDCTPCQKWAKRGGFVACPKTMAGVRRLKKIRTNAFRVAGSSDVRRSGHWFPEKGRFGASDLEVC